MANGDGWWALASGLFLTGFVLGVMFAKPLYEYHERLVSSRERLQKWIKEGDEIDHAVAGDDK